MARQSLRIAAALAACLMVPPAAALSCPPPPDHAAALEDLMAQLRLAPTEMAARAITNRMWTLWADAPDEPAQEILDDGMQRRAAFDLLGAIGSFDRLIAYCPDYAEGYNQRAFAHFLSGNFDKALVDLDAALERAPRHLAALSGRGLTLLQLGRTDEARADLRAALALTPWLPERAYLPPEDIPAPATDL